MSPVAGVILAGGLARRMGGGDKGLLRLGGRPIIDHVIERLKPQVGPLAINANGDPLRFAPYRLPVLPDTVEGHAGPLAGVLAGLEWAKALKSQWMVTAATDTPFFPGDLVRRLLEAVAEDNAELACASSFGRSHPVFGLWATRLTDDLRHALVNDGIRKVDEWTGRHRLALAGFEARTHDPFFNVNRPEDVAAAEDILGACHP